ncbi:MAG: HAMP domain-containing histidine kinase [Tissierellales bacterium]|nr:HAMP domain-containing histidine kinase [Tissierellales bacterium]
MKKSIKSRLIKNFMIIIILTVLIIEITLITGVKEYFYKNVETIIINQLELSTTFYEKYFSSANLSDIVIDDVDAFWLHTNAQVQILDIEGKVLMDSLGFDHGEAIYIDEVTKVLTQGKYTYVGNVEYTNEPVMSVSMPLLRHNSPVGVMKFTTSLEVVNEDIKQISKVLILIGTVVIIISGIISNLLAKSIVKPILELTTIAEKMTDAQFKVRSKEYKDKEIDKLSSTLNYMAEEVTRREKIKDDFISSVSHELKTPLTSIKGWAITLKSYDNIDEAILKDGLDIIETESDRLANMVDELLDFSRFTSGRISLVKESLDLNQLCKSVANQLMPRAINNKINFNIFIPDEKIFIIGDLNRIKQVLINILDNAFKFAENGNVDFVLYQEEDYAFIKISDDGPGISNEDLPHIKEKFYRGNNSNSHSGIGLSICDEIMKLHNGLFEIYSEETKGTTVLLGFLKEEVV